MPPETDVEAQPLLADAGAGGDGDAAPRDGGAGAAPDDADVEHPLALGECRICGDEAPVAALEAPCACRGGLRFVHAKCLQRWVDEKGDLTCEICRAPFVGPFTAPPPRPPPSPRRAATGPLSAEEAVVLAAELSRRFAAHAAAERRGSACLLVTLTLLAVLLLRQAVAVASRERSADGDADATASDSASFYLAALRAIACVAPLWCLLRVAAAARMRAAAAEAHAARDAALTALTAHGGGVLPGAFLAHAAWMPAAAAGGAGDAHHGAVIALQGTPQLHLPQPALLPAAAAATRREALYAPRVHELLHEAQSERQASAERAEAALIAYVDAAEARPRAAAATAPPAAGVADADSRTPPPPPPLPAMHAAADEAV